MSDVNNRTNRTNRKISSNETYRYSKHKLQSINQLSVQGDIGFLQVIERNRSAERWLNDLHQLNVSDDSPYLFISHSATTFAYYSPSHDMHIRNQCASAPARVAHKELLITVITIKCIYWWLMCRNALAAREPNVQIIIIGWNIDSPRGALIPHEYLVIVKVGWSKS